MKRAREMGCCFEYEYFQRATHPLYRWKDATGFRGYVHVDAKARVYFIRKKKKKREKLRQKEEKNEQVD